MATPITPSSPYSFTSSAGMGSPFLAGGAITVQGSGATGAGFAPFSEQFTATTLLQSANPALSTLKAADVFSPAGLSLGWQTPVRTQSW